MISKALQLIVCIVFLASCTTTDSSSLEASSEDEPINKKLPIITSVQIQAPCFFHSDLFNLLKKRDYVVFSQIVNESNGYVVLTFRKKKGVNRYIIIVRTPQLACVIGGGAGISGV